MHNIIIYIYSSRDLVFLGEDLYFQVCPNLVSKPQDAGDIALEVTRVKGQVMLLCLNDKRRGRVLQRGGGQEYQEGQYSIQPTCTTSIRYSFSRMQKELNKILLLFLIITFLQQLLLAISYSMRATTLTTGVGKLAILTLLIIPFIKAIIGP